MSTLEDSSLGEPVASSPGIPKWPFVFGDLLLVTSALAVWATQPQLSETQLFFCLAAVAVGAMLFAAPYVLDHYARALASRERPSPAPGMDHQKLAAFEGDLRRQLRAGTEALEQAARANAAFEGSARRFETRLAPLSEIQKKFEGIAAELREASARPAVRDTQPLDRELTRLREEQAEKFKAADAKLAKLAEAISALSVQLDHLAESPAPVPPAAPAPVTETPPPVEKRPESSGSMLAKALAAAQPAGETPAVAGIIQSRPRRPRKPKVPETSETVHSPESSPSEPGDPATPVDIAPASTPAVAQREGWDSLAEGKFDQVTTAAETATQTASAPVEVETPPPALADTTEEFVTETKTARAKAAALRAADDKEETSAASAPANAETPSDEPAQGELLAGAAETSRKRRSHKTTADASALVARVLIGIGNKPFVRGEGPGLSPTKGVPMEFVEIGKWQWVAPAPAAGPIKLQILKNDEVPATGEPIVLQPGQNLEVSPVFPA